MKRSSLSSPIFFLGLFVSLIAGQPAYADEPAIPTSGAITVRLEEAVELALIYNYALRRARIEDKTIRETIRRDWSPVWPQLDGTAQYTRNITAPNPFAGSGAGNAFGALDAIGWLAFNEDARQNGDEPISFGEFVERTNTGLANAGVVIDPDANPFLVENQFNFTLTIRQTLYDGAVFAGLRGTDVAREIGQAGIDDQALRTIQSTASAFYGALLAARQTEIRKKSVDRTQATVDETKRRVQQGVVPQFELLTAEVELANLQTDLARSENAAAKSLDDLRLQIGLPPGQPLRVSGELTLKGVAADLPTAGEAIELAFEKRPDYRQAMLNVEAGEIKASATWAEYLPKLNAFANLTYQGSVPDDRSFTVATEDLNDDPFAVERRTSDFFSEGFWFSSVSVGLLIEWNIFDGFATTARVAMDRLETQRARINLDERKANIHLEVEQSLRQLNTARQQITTQERNRDRAELNYQHAEVRVREGVSNQFELRQASEQLDESRFNYLQAVHDFLVARITYLVAIGTPPMFGGDAK